MNEKEDQKKGDKRAETTMIFSNKRDENKDPKKLGKDAHLKEDDSDKNDVHKKEHVNKKNRTTEREKRQTNKQTKKYSKKKKNKR